MPRIRGTLTPWLAAAAAFAWAGEAPAVVFDDGGVHSIRADESFAAEPVIVHDSPDGLSTVLNVEAGGEVGTALGSGADAVSVSGRSVVNITGGEVGAVLRAGDRAVVNVTGGSVDSIELADHAVANLGGGWVGAVWLADEAAVNPPEAASTVSDRGGPPRGFAASVWREREPGFPAVERVFRVTAFEDGVDVAPGDGFCRTADGRCTLRAAVMETNELPGAQGLELEAGDYAVTFPPETGDGDADPEIGDLDVFDDLVIRGTRIDGALASRILGASSHRALEVHGGVFVGLRDLEISQGSACPAWGGAIENSGDLVVIDSLLHHNGGEDGGGLSNLGAATLLRTTLDSNDGNTSGGIRNFGLLALRESTLRDNQSGYVGGIWSHGALLLEATSVLGSIPVAVQADGSDTTIVSSTISGSLEHIAGAEGVAVRGRGEIYASTVVNNDEGIWGDFYLEGTVLDSSSPFGDCAGTIVSGGHNLIGEPGVSCVIDARPSDLIGSAASPIDPRLAPLADNGGPTPTHELLPDSPALDAIDAIDCAFDHDQRGVPRPLDGDDDGTPLCDIGAVESGRFAALDIRPGVPGPAWILLGAGQVQAAILGSEGLPVREIDRSSLSFGPAGAQPLDPSGGRRRDVDGDGLPDLVSRYDVAETGIAFGDEAACVTGRTRDGTPFSGCDAIQVFGACGLGFELALVLPPLLALYRRRRARG